jgi:hypothetical protein
LATLTHCGLVLVLFVLPAVALPALGPARPLPHQPALLAAFAPTRTACHFTTGPLAGTTGDYVSPSDQKIGSACDDGKGSRGTVVPLNVPMDREHAAPAPEHPAQPQPPPAQAAPPAPPPLSGAPAPIPQPPAPEPHPGPSTAYANLTDSQIQQEFDQIVKRAGNGAIQYNVPPAMTEGQPVTVQAEIYGVNAQPQSMKDFQATGSGNLKVTPLMEVDLSAPNSPGMFKIDPDPVQTGQQLVPDDGKFTWVWTVTPLQAAQQPGSLEIDAYMVLNDKLPDGQAITRQIKSYSVQVPVKPRSPIQTVLNFLANNWIPLLSFIVPSGVGLTWIAGILGKKKAKKKGKPRPA